MEEMREKTEQDSVLSMLATKTKLIDVVRYCRVQLHARAHTHIHTLVYSIPPLLVRAVE